MISKILASQSPNVDAVSGATYSSNGIIQAVQNALSQAMPSGSQAEVTPIPEATPTPGPTPTSTPEPTKAPVPTPKPEEEQLYKDGTYTGTGKGYSGTVILTAKIKKGVITSLDVTHTDTPMFFDKAWGVLENEIIQNQTTEGIDTVSGATFSSKGILSAMKDILKQAKKGTAKPTPTRNRQLHQNQPPPRLRFRLQPRSQPQHLHRKSQRHQILLRIRTKLQLRNQHSHRTKIQMLLRR